MMGHLSRFAAARVAFPIILFFEQCGGANQHRFGHEPVAMVFMGSMRAT